MSTILPEPDKRPMDPIAIPHAGDRSAKVDESIEPIVIRVGFIPFVRTMWALFWTAFRHPMTTTYIDVATGNVVQPDEDEF